MENSTFTFALNFKSDAVGKIEIEEPVKFDSADFSLEQGKNRYGRDITFGNEEVDLSFQGGTFQPLATPQQLPNGTVIYYKSMGLPWLLQYYKTYGFESEVEFIVSRDGVDFTVGILDFKYAKTDMLTYFDCKVIQNTKRAQLKRNGDVKIDVFSDKNLDQEAITPLNTTNILVKALPLTQTSKWIQGSAYTAKAGIARYYSPNAGLQQYELEDSYVPFYNVMSGLGEDIYDATNNFRFIFARNDIAGITVKIVNDVTFLYRATDGDSSDIASMRLCYNVYQHPYQIGDPVTTQYAYEKEFSGNTDIDFTIPEEIEFSIPFIGRDYSYSVFWQFTWTTAHLGDGNRRTRWVFNSSTMTVKGASRALPSVIKAVPYIKLFEQSAKSINGMPIVAPRFQTGEFSKLYAFNGFLLRQFEDRPMYVTWKDLTENLIWLNADYQTTRNEVFIGIEDDFYPNREIAVHPQSAEVGFVDSFTERHCVNVFEYKFSNFEKGEGQEDTLDSVHTEIQLKVPNKQVEGKRTIKTDLILDAKKIEKLRRQAITTDPNKATDDDDNIAILDVIPLAPGTTESFSANLLQRIDDDDNLQILNSSTTEPGNFSWNLLGFAVGTSFVITQGQNSGTYTVMSVTPSVLTLSGGSPSFEGNEIITVVYFLSNVQYVCRTSQGFDSITGVDSPGEFSNLLYTPKRIVETLFAKQLATMSLYKRGETITVQYHKNNGELATVYNGGAEIKENADIEVNSLPDPILSPRSCASRLTLNFSDALSLYEAYDTIHDDGTIGGFVRCYDPTDAIRKIYLTKSPYVWSQASMKLSGEVRNESDLLTIVSGGGILTINEVGYGTDIVPFVNPQFSGDYVTLYDGNTIALINPTHYSKVSVNGVVYDNAEDLAVALGEL